MKSKFFSSVRRYYWLICVGYCIPFILIFIRIHVYYHYNQGARFVKDRLPASHVYKFEGVEFEEFNLKTSESATINAGLFKKLGQPSKGVIYFFHGNVGSLTKHFVYAEALLSYGYDVMLIDWRGYGKSVGKCTEKAFYDDSQLVYELLKKRYDQNHIYLMGHSFGCAMAANIASRNHPAALVLIGPLFSFEDAQQNCPWYIPKITEFTFRTDLFIQETEAPVYLFSGSKDILNEASIRLSKLLKNGDEYIEIKNANHLSIFFDFPEFKTHLERILKVEGNSLVKR